MRQPHGTPDSSCYFETHHRSDNNNMVLLSNMFLAAGKVFYIPQTWVALVQINIADPKAFIYPGIIVEHR